MFLNFFKKNSINTPSLTAKDRDKKTNRTCDGVFMYKRNGWDII